jgi:hypothetical protein
MGDDRDDGGACVELLQGLRESRRATVDRKRTGISGLINGDLRLLRNRERAVDREKQKTDGKSGRDTGIVKSHSQRAPERIAEKARGIL